MIQLQIKKSIEHIPSRDSIYIDEKGIAVPSPLGKVGTKITIEKVEFEIIENKIEKTEENKMEWIITLRKC